jgi:hypothetical protein
MKAHLLRGGKPYLLQLLKEYDILPPPNQRFGGGFQLFLHVTPSQPLLRERFVEFSVLTSSTGLGPLPLKTESGYGGLEGSSHSSGAPFGGEHKFGVAPPYLDERMFYRYKNILPIFCQFIPHGTSWQ